MFRRAVINILSSHGDCSFPKILISPWKTAQEEMGVSGALRSNNWQFIRFPRLQWPWLGRGAGIGGGVGGVGHTGALVWKLAGLGWLGRRRALFLVSMDQSTGERRFCYERQIHLLPEKVWSSFSQLPAWTLSLNKHLLSSSPLSCHSFIALYFLLL